MGSPNLAQQQQAVPAVTSSMLNVEKAVSGSVYNGDLSGLQGAISDEQRRRMLDHLARAYGMQGMTASAPPAPPRYGARTSVQDALSRAITDKIVAAMPPTAAIKINSVLVIHGVGEPAKVVVTFCSGGLNDVLTLTLTDDFPSEADISRILLAMP